MKLYNVTVRSVHLMWADSPDQAIEAARAILRLHDIEPLCDVGDDAFVSEPIESMGWAGE